MVGRAARFRLLAPPAHEVETSHYYFHWIFIFFNTVLTPF